MQSLWVWNMSLFKARRVKGGLLQQSVGSSVFVEYQRLRVRISWPLFKCLNVVSKSLIRNTNLLEFTFLKVLCGVLIFIYTFICCVAHARGWCTFQSLVSHYSNDLQVVLTQAVKRQTEEDKMLKMFYKKIMKRKENIQHVDEALCFWWRWMKKRNFCLRDNSTGHLWDWSERICVNS